MDIHIKDSNIKFAAWAIGIAFTAYFTANSLYVEHPEAEITREDLQEAIDVARSDQLGEVANYYRQASKTRDLTSAEKFRYNIVVRRQCRIDAKMKSNSTTEFTIAMKECDELDPIGEL